jgi:hypothetical protein
MERNNVKKLTIFSGLNSFALAMICHTAGMDAHAQDFSQWPAGPNTCLGTWSYSEYESCQHPSHGSDTNNPISVTDGDRCGYHQVTNSCWHGDVHSRTVITPEVQVARADHWWHDHEVEDHCKSKTLDIPINEQEKVANVTVHHLVRGRDCKDKDWKNKCVRWYHNIHVQCSYTINTKVYGANADACGTSNGAPKTCNIGYQDIAKRSSACKANPVVSPRNFNASSLMAEPWRVGFSCSTGDHLPANAPSQVTQKYEFLISKLLQNPDSKNPDFPHLKEALRYLVENRAQSLNEDQQQKARIILTADEIKTSSMTKGVAFDAAAECLSNGSGSVWSCPNKKVRFDFGDLAHFPQIAPYTAFSHKLGYKFQCLADSKAVSIRLFSGESELNLGSSANAVMETLSTTYKVGAESPSLLISTDKSVLVPAQCKLDIISNSIELDSTLLLASSNAQLSKLRLLNSTRSELNTAAQLPAKYKSVLNLKEKLSDQIVEDTFKCQELALNANVEPDAICPGEENPNQICQKTWKPQTGELGLVLDRIKSNSCLYSDTDKGLPITVNCTSQGNTDLCLAGVKKVSQLVESEYQKVLGSAQRLNAALVTEKARITGNQADLERKISLIIEALNKGLAGLPASGSADPVPPDTRPVSSGKKVIYDGEKAPFSMGQTWDASQSNVTEYRSAGQHLRFTINNQNWWGAAAYIMDNYAPVDISAYKKMTLRLKANKAVRVKLFLISMETNAESEHKDFDLTTAYQTVTVDLGALAKSGFDLKSPQGLVVATSVDGDQAFVVDADDVIVE